MINEGTYEKDWINSLSTQIGKRGDPKLLEKVIYAFTLLEQLQSSGLNFIFKGGTSLLLISPIPRRFSIDIDIIADYELNDIPTYLDRVVAMGKFKRWTPNNERKSSPAAPVAHFKFYYTSQVDSYFGEEPILLDLLLGKNPYPVTKEVSIQHPWLQTAGEILTAQIPITESILGDKLTAFAPHKIGILYTKQRPVEIIKQLFDIGFLFDEAKEISIIKASYLKNAAEEIKYRNLIITWQDALEDSFLASLTISKKDTGEPNYPELQKGIFNIVNFILGKFTLEEAITCAAKAAYLSILLRQDNPAIKPYNGPEELTSWEIKDDTKLNKLKKTNPEAFFTGI